MNVSALGTKIEDHVSSTQNSKDETPLDFVSLSSGSRCCVYWFLMPCIICPRQSLRDIVFAKEAGAELPLPH